MGIKPISERESRAVSTRPLTFDATDQLTVLLAKQAPAFLIAHGWTFSAHRQLRRDRLLPLIVLVLPVVVLAELGRRRVRLTLVVLLGAVPRRLLLAVPLEVEDL